MSESESVFRYQRQPFAREIPATARQAAPARTRSVPAGPSPRAKSNGATGVLRESARETRSFGINVSAHSLPIVAAAAEFVTITTATFLAGALYHHLLLSRFPTPAFYFLATVCLAGLFVVPCGLRRDYSLKRLLDRKEQFRSVLVHWHSAYSLFVFALFMTYATDFYSRGSILAQYAAGLAAAAAVRFIMIRLVTQGLRTGNLRGKRVVVVGKAALVGDIVQQLRRDGQGADIIGIIRLSDRMGEAGAPAAQEEIGRALRAIEELARSTPPDDVVINLPWSERDGIRTLVDGLAAVPATIHLAPDRDWAWAGDPRVSHVGYIPTIQLSRVSMTLKDRVLKRVFDLAVASLLLALTAPLLLIIALLIKLDAPGPVLFRQRRNGFNQKEFRVLKFRTMRTLDDGPVIQQAKRGDERITRFGRFLRATNLDELPQLFNVFAGHMSFVGPRPHAVAHNNEYEEKIQLYARRHNVKPGITGWAQVNGYRGETDSIDKMRRRIEHDLFYIDHWSLLFDIKIIIMTAVSPKSYRNAF